MPCTSTEIQFALLSAIDMQRMSHLQVVNKEIYQPTPAKDPIEYGCLDRRLGVCQKTGRCSTCGEDLITCPGHFGFINLCIPVFHIGYFRAIHQILQIICKTCSRVLLKPPERQEYILQLRYPELEPLARDDLFQEIMTKGKRMSECPYCAARNGTSASESEREIACCV